MKSVRAKQLIYLFKAVFSVSLISWIVSRVNTDEIWPDLFWRGFGCSVAFTLYFVGYVIVALRWRTLLRVHGVNPPMRILVQSFSISVFFNNLLPSTIGGDLSRVFDSWRFGSSKTVALIVVVVDRFVGMCAMLLLAGVAFLVAPQVITRIPALQTTMILMFVLAIASNLFLFGVPRQLVSQITANLCRLPGRVGRVSKKLVHGVSAYWGRNNELARALLLSLLLQIVVIVHFIFIAQALQIRVPYAAMFIVIPAVLMVMMAPVTINAIGIREAAFVYFLSFYGVSKAQSLALAWVQFGFVILQGIVGGVIFLFRRESSHSRADSS
jgi:uncharacterized protein (TIRG00374 family)